MGKKINRSYVLVCGVLVLLCMGLIYAWSIFVGPIESDFGWTRTQTSMTFSISMLGFQLADYRRAIFKKLNLQSLLSLWELSCCWQASSHAPRFISYGSSLFFMVFSVVMVLVFAIMYGWALPLPITMIKPALPQAGF